MRAVQAGDPAVADRPPLGVRVVHGSRREPDWLTMSYDELLAYRDAENRTRASRLARPVTGFPDRGAAIEWQEVPLPGRRVPVRVYRPAAGRAPAPGGRLPLVLHVHGGGFVGTAAQSDWVNSHLAARLSAVVVSVEHRLLDHRTPLAAALDDGWDVLELAVRGGGARWRVDAERVAVLGESTGGLIAGLMALRDRELALRAQVLVNPVTDLTPAGFEVPSMRQRPPGSTLAVEQMRLLQRLADPTGLELKTLSPMPATGLSHLPPTLVVVPTVDPIADQGRGYAERLRSAGVPVQLSEYRGAPHAFLSMPGLVRAARAARTEIREFLRGALGRSLVSR